MGAIAQFKYLWYNKCSFNIPWGCTLENAQVVVALSCGGRVNSTWDPTDYALAAYASEVAIKRGIPVMAQWEVADLLPSSVLAQYIIRAHRTQDRRLDTREVLEQIRVECDKLGHTHIALVAHRIHAPRAKRVAEKLGFSVEIIDTPHCELDPDSMYWWVRSDWVFTLYEKFLSTPIYRYRGWI